MKEETWPWLKELKNKPGPCEELQLAVHEGGGTEGWNIGCSHIMGSLYVG